MSVIFDGKNFAKKTEEQLIKKTASLRRRGTVPKMITFVDPNNEEAVKYATLKQKAATRVGAMVEIYNINKLRGIGPLIQLIKLSNLDPSIHGIMVQLPVPPALRPDLTKIFNQIAHKKDVDGLGENSSFLPATVKAVISILGEAGVTKSDSILIVGSKGQVGKRLVKCLSYKGYAVEGVDKAETRQTRLFQKCQKADVIISSTGVPNLITADKVQDNAVVIDVGSPKGDAEAAVSLRTRFFTPVPGGVGPVTVIGLMENLVEAASKK